jgi:hypothetical protein
MVRAQSLPFRRVGGFGSRDPPAWGRQEACKAGWGYAVDRVCVLAHAGVCAARPRRYAKSGRQGTQPGTEQV